MRRPLAGIRFVVFDFDGVFTDNRVLVFQDGREAVFCSRADGLGVERLRATGLPLLVLSKEANPVVTARCRKLRLPCVQSCDDKLPVLVREARKRGVPLSSVCYVGNDVNDLDCLRAVGFPVCVADAIPEVKRVCRRVLRNPGGRGAVRELCDLFLAATK